MMTLLRRLPPETIPLLVNIGMLVIYVGRREPGKVLYWIGACLLTVGLMIMKG